jgi:streptogramin lyase
VGPLRRICDAWRNGPSKVLILALLWAGLTNPAQAQQVDITPRGAYGIAAGSDGNLWFTEYFGNRIGRITTSGVLTEFSISTIGSQPTSIAAGADGNLWFTEVLGNKIGRITTAGVITEFSVPTPPTGIAAGPDGNLWFIEGQKIGRMTVDGILSGEYDAPKSSGLADITAGPDGALWFTFKGSQALPPFHGCTNSGIGRITTSGFVTHFDLPTTSCDAQQLGQITTGPDGNLWFTKADTIGRITTAGSFTEFSIPAFSSQPAGIASGPDGNLWFTERCDCQNQIGRITTAGVVTEFRLPTAFSFPTDIVAGQDGRLWFTESNAIGQITTAGSISEFSLPPEICAEDGYPTILCLDRGRFQVRAHWEAAAQATTGDGTAVPLTSDSGYFWFFDSANVEVVVKVLNACSAEGGHYWVFAGGLTNIFVTLTVTDTQTLAVRTYTNPAGTAFRPIQDTAAFSTCP